MQLREMLSFAHSEPMAEPPLRKLLEVAERCEAEGREVLNELYGTAPLLIVKATGESDGAILITTSEEGFKTEEWSNVKDSAKTQAGSLKSPFLAIAEPGSLIVPVVKTDLNPFAGMIIVGRAGNNDIRLASSNVSKVHAFLKQDGDSWSVQDRSSTNGTLVNSVALEPNQEYQLNFGDELRFGDVPCMFMDAERMYTLSTLVLRSFRGG